MLHLAALHDLGTAVRSEFRAFSLQSPRALRALRPVLSVAIAVAAAHALDLQDSWWAAITAYVVMQADFGASLHRGLHRVLGTLAGAAAGFMLGPVIAGHPVPFVLLMAAAAWGGLFAALVFAYSYAWVLALVTFVMVMCEAMGPTAPLAGFALERVANIVLGTAACVIVAGLTDARFIAALRRHGTRPAPSSSPAAAPADRRAAALLALQGALTVALMAVIVSIWDLRSFSQAMVTTLAVLIVPLGDATLDVRGTVVQRMVQRLAGCLLAGAVALALLPLIGQQPWWCRLALCLGVWAGAWLQAGAAGVRYMAVQFSAAFLMVFVQDSGWTVQALPALERFGGIFAGIVSLSLVLAAFSRWRRSGKA